MLGLILWLVFILLVSVRCYKPVLPIELSRSISDLTKMEKFLLQRADIISQKHKNYLFKRLTKLVDWISDYTKWVFPSEYVLVISGVYLSATFVLLIESILGMLLMFIAGLSPEWSFLFAGSSCCISIYPLASLIRHATTNKTHFKKEFAFMIQFFAVLSGVGMHLELVYRHWCAQNHSPAMRLQLRAIDRERQRGLTFYESWVIWQNLLDSRSVKRFVGLMVQGSRHGLRDLATGFWQIASDDAQYAYLTIKRQAEQVSSKLLMPMMISLIVLLMVLMYPAIGQMTML